MPSSNNVEKIPVDFRVSLVQNSLMWILEMILVVPMHLIHE